MKQKIDGHAQTYLRHISKRFSAYLGEMEAAGDEIVFRSPPEPLQCVRIKNKKNKFLLGGMFSLQITGEYEMPSMEQETATIAIGYKGMMVRGPAYFTQKDGRENGMAGKLNNADGLIETLNGLDLEKGNQASRREA